MYVCLSICLSVSQKVLLSRVNIETVVVYSQVAKSSVDTYLLLSNCLLETRAGEKGMFIHSILSRPQTVLRDQSSPTPTPTHSRRI